MKDKKKELELTEELGERILAISDDWTKKNNLNELDALRLEFITFIGLVSSSPFMGFLAGVTKIEVEE